MVVILSFIHPANPGLVCTQPLLGRQSLPGSPLVRRDLSFLGILVDTQNPNPMPTRRECLTQPVWGGDAQDIVHLEEGWSARQGQTQPPGRGTGLYSADKVESAGFQAEG